jgi:hypothetical protein
MEIQIDIEAVTRRLESMRKQIDWFKSVGMGLEMDVWQEADMGRAKPFTLRARRAGYVRTTIHPHSYYETLKRAGAKGRATKQLKRQLRKKALFLTKRRRRKKRKPGRPIQRWSDRPILREQLEKQLMERMGEYLKQKVNWEEAKRHHGGP